LSAVGFGGNISNPKAGAKSMVSDPEELLPKKKVPEIAIGQDLSAMSEHELIARIATLESEIARSREAIDARRATKSAADAFFRKT
jgi:uncharacterized small protein (DUF1192 family)